ncbi:hypothetical protein L6164_025175 [Bauhinia variegata]|uniref:Uncharacterized protein n=1 Tax=Bauhinia variegata TaxID=167791 RepID=A0ACB9LZI1_BAUVA|nr:hypothetical protein L6164_025175 [Bauhinia variegata]
MPEQNGDRFYVGFVQCLFAQTNDYYFKAFSFSVYIPRSTHNFNLNLIRLDVQRLLPVGSLWKTRQLRTLSNTNPLSLPRTSAVFLHQQNPASSCQILNLLRIKAVTNKSFP